MGNLKSIVRNALPRRWQVPIKYWYGRVSGGIEKEMELLGLLVSRGDHVLDIGGNRGIYAYRLAKLGVRLEVFEPNPVCSSILQGWASARKDVRVHSVALSSGSGTAKLHVPVDEHGVEHDASASIQESVTGNVRDLDVELRPLDSFGFTDISLIKIDVEGHETSVIEGAKATLAASNPALIIEIEQRHNSRPIAGILAQVEGFGYRGFFFKDGKLVPLAHFDPARHQSMEAFGANSEDYINNFIFLGSERLDRGEYKALMSGWATP